MHSANELLTQASGRIDEKLLQIDRVTKTIILDYEIVNFLNQKIRSEQNFSLNDKVFLANKINKNIAFTDDLLSVEVYNNGQLISQDAFGFKASFSASDKRKVASARGDVVWFGYYNTIGEKSTFIPGTVVASRWFSSLNGEHDVYILIYIRPTFFNDVFGNVAFGNTRLTLVDSYGMVLADSYENYENNLARHSYKDIALLNQDKETIQVGERQYYQSVYRSNYTDWRTVGRISYDELVEPQRIIARLFFIIGGIGLFIAFILSLYWSMRISRPVQHITKGIRRIENGDLSVRLPVSGTMEIQKVSQAFNHMVDELQSLIQKLSDETQHKELAELKALQSQINPHFLYNTLDTFYWMLIARNQDDVAELIISLGHYLRYSIQNSGKIVKLEEEIYYIHQYFAIQKLRFPDKLEVIFDISPETVNYKIPKLLIQPLVENALSHGLQFGEKGIVRISSEIKDGLLQIHIIDNGKGIEEQQLNKIQLLLKDGIFESASSEIGIGILNVHKRILIAYGPQYGLTINSVENQGTEVIICLPSK